MKAIIIDDIEITHSIITKIINTYFENIEIIDTAYNVAKGVDIINKHNPDIVFLDINLPDGTGFDILKKINNTNFKLIFVTAHQEYALNAIKFSALDFLLKPLDEDEIITAINNAISKIKDDENQLKIETFINNFENQDKNQKIVLKTQDNIYIAKVNDIIRCEADGNYTKIYINQSSNILISKTLKEYEELLKNYNFIRVHKSHLININYIEHFEKRDSGTIYMIDGSKIGVSHRKKEVLLNALNNLLG